MNGNMVNPQFDQPPLDPLPNPLVAELDQRYINYIQSQNGLPPPSPSQFPFLAQLEQQFLNDIYSVDYYRDAERRLLRRTLGLLFLPLLGKSS